MKIPEQVKISFEMCTAAIFNTINMIKLVPVSLFDPDPHNLVNKDHWAVEVAWADGRK